MQDLAQRTALALLLCLAALPVCAQERGERRVIPVSVIDREGKLVEGLTAADFRGEFRGKPVTIHPVAWDESPRTVLLLIDVSASMRDNPPAWQFEWNAAGRLASMLLPAHSVGVLTFSNAVYYHGLLTGKNEESEIIRFIDGLEVAARQRGGSTLFFDALAVAAERGSSLTPTPILFAISDCIDTESVIGSDQVGEKLARTRARTYFLILPPSPFEPGPWARGARRTVREIAAKSGGNEIDLSHGIPKNRDAPVGLLDFVQTMTRNYVLDVEFLQQVDKPREWKLEVVDGSGKKRKDVEIAYPRLLVPRDSEKDKRKKE